MQQFSAVTEFKAGFFKIFLKNLKKPKILTFNFLASCKKA